MSGKILLHLVDCGCLVHADCTVCYEDLGLVLLIYDPWKHLCVISLEHGFRAVLVGEGKMMVLQVFLLKSSLQWSLTGPNLSCVVISMLVI